MSKLIALIVGLFLFIWISTVIVLILAHISRVIFSGDTLMGIKEFFIVLLFPLVLIGNSRYPVWSIVFKRPKRNQ